MSEQPSEPTTGECTLSYTPFGLVQYPDGSKAVMAWNESEARRLVEWHNATIRNAHPLLDEALKQLSAERKNAEKAAARAERAQIALAAEIALADEIKKTEQNRLEIWRKASDQIDIQEAVIAKLNLVSADALAAEQEKVQTLVELLEQVLLETVNTPIYPDGPCLNKETRDDIKTALAKVK